MQCGCDFKNGVMYWVEFVCDWVPGIEMGEVSLVYCILDIRGVI